MKKLKIFSVFLFTLFAFSFLPKTKATTNTSILLDALDATLETENLQADSTATFSLGENKFTVGDKLKKDDNKKKHENSFDFHFDMGDLSDDVSEELMSEFDFLSKNLMIDLEADSTLYLNTKNGDIFYEVSDYDVNIDAENEDVQNILEGFFEITKIFTGETYYVNFEAIMEEFDKFADIYAEINELNIQNANNNDWETLLEIVLKSGLFDVNLENDTFVITLKKEVNFIDVDLITEKINELAFLPENQKEMILYDFDEELSESDYKEINEALDEINKYVDFSVKIDVVGEYIRNVEVGLTVDLENMLEDNGENISIDDFVYTQSVELNYKNISVSLPLKSNTQISLNKIIKLFLSVERQWQSQWDDYDYEDYDYDYSDYYYDDEVEEIVDFDTNAWYVPYVEDLIDKEVIYSVDNPAEKLTESRLGDILYEAEWYANNLGIDVNDDYWYELDSNNRISKFDALNHIIKTLFPDEKFVVAFAMKNGIVSNSFNISEARNSDVTIVEVVKMLSVSLQILENQ